MWELLAQVEAASRGASILQLISTLHLGLLRHLLLAVAAAHSADEIAGVAPARTCATQVAHLITSTHGVHRYRPPNIHVLTTSTTARTVIHHGLAAGHIVPATPHLLLALLHSSDEHVHLVTTSAVEIVPGSSAAGAEAVHLLLGLAVHLKLLLVSVYG